MAILEHIRNSTPIRLPCNRIAEISFRVEIFHFDKNRFLAEIYKKFGSKSVAVLEHIGNSTPNRLHANGSPEGEFSIELWL